MTPLRFPNPSRNFDETKNRVQFWGYDSALEITFFVEANVLKTLCPDMSGLETGILDAFDGALSRIHEAANDAYTRRRGYRGPYILAAEDF